MIGSPVFPSSWYTLIYIEIYIYIYIYIYICLYVNWYILMHVAHVWHGEWTLRVCRCKPTCHEGALALGKLTLHVSQALQGIGQLISLLLQQRIIHAALLFLLLHTSRHTTIISPSLADGQCVPPVCTHTLAWNWFSPHLFAPEAGSTDFHCLIACVTPALLVALCMLSKRVVLHKYAYITFVCAGNQCRLTCLVWHLWMSLVWPPLACTGSSCLAAHASDLTIDCQQ